MSSDRVSLALTLWPEWAGAFALLGKATENRTWAPPASAIGQRIAIHAGARTGGGVGTMTRIHALEAVVRMAVREGWRLHRDGTLRRGEQRMRLTDVDMLRSGIVAVGTLVSHDTVMRTGWDVPGQVHWRFEDVTPVRFLPCCGLQKLWRVSDALADALHEDLYGT